MRSFAKSLIACAAVFVTKRNCAPFGVSHIAGIDEAGRGALAGPVVAAAVILPEKFRHRKLKDSKQLAPELREEIYQELTSHARRSSGRSASSIRSRSTDQYSARHAQGDARAVAGLTISPDHVLIDGLPVFPFRFRKPRSSMAIASA